MSSNFKEEFKMMADDILDRMKESKGFVSDSELARFIERPKSTLSNWRTKGSIPLDAIVFFIYKQHGMVSFDWIIKGTGSPMSSDVGKVLGGEAESSSDEHANALAQSPCVFSPVGFADRDEEMIFEGTANALLEDIQSIEEEIELIQEPEDMPTPVLTEAFKNKLIEGVQYLKELGAPRKLYGMKGSGDTKELALLPLLNVEASAGHGSLVEQEDPQYMVAFNRDWLRRETGVAIQNLRIIYAKGDSMNSGHGKDKDIHDGDLLLVNTQVTRVESDAIYIIQIHGQLIVKRIQQMFDGSIKIISANPDYETQTVAAEETQNICIVGSVVFVMAGRKS